MSDEQGRRLRVAIVAYSFAQGGGSEYSISWLAAERLSAFCDVTVITRPAVAGSIAFSGTTRIVSPALGTRLLRPWPRLRGMHGMQRWQEHVVEALASGRWGAFDLVHHLSPANLIAAVTPRGGRTISVVGPVSGGQDVPLRLVPVLGVRGGLTETARRVAKLLMVRRPGFRRALHRVPLVLAANAETAAWARRMGAPNVATVSMLQLEADVRPVVTGGKGSRRAVAVGRLLPWKGVAVAVDAMAQLPDWSLEIIGTGPDERRLRRRAVKRGVADRVHFAGQLSRADCLTRISTAACLVHPSLREGGGLVVAEARAMNVPVVCSGWGGTAETARTIGAEGIEALPAALPAEFARRLARAVSEQGDFTPSLVNDDLSAAWGEEAVSDIYRHYLQVVAARVASSDPG